MTWLAIIAAPLVLAAGFVLLAFPAAWWWKRRGNDPTTAEFSLTITGIYVGLLLVILPIWEAAHP